MAISIWMAFRKKEKACLCLLLFFFFLLWRFHSPVPELKECILYASTHLSCGLFACVHLCCRCPNQTQSRCRSFLILSEISYLFVTSAQTIKQQTQKEYSVHWWQQTSTDKSHQPRNWIQLFIIPWYVICNKINNIIRDRNCVISKSAYVKKPS